MKFVNSILLVLSFTGAQALALEAQAIPDEHLENLHRLTPKVLSGAEPHDEAAFKALSSHGVKTVISVDGAKPKVDLAKKYGMRYVHLPIGYDGVPTEKTKDLAKALIELDGPIYVHCHHGKHRGPAAAAAACVAGGLLSNDEAVNVLTKMGTGANYAGLWKSARTTATMPLEELKKRNVDFREIAAVPPIAEAMVHVDEKFDHLKLAQKAGWEKPKDHPDIDPPHEALQLRELLFELMRTDEFKAKPDDYKKWTEESLLQAESLHKLLKDGPPTAEAKTKSDALMTSLKKGCADCHKAYRDKK
jgi:protein tyrosine phosphatase (PTP) superfamily phosphohydrolase (DUF442 family)